MTKLKTFCCCAYLIELLLAQHPHLLDHLIGTQILQIPLGIALYDIPYIFLHSAADRVKRV